MYIHIAYQYLFHSCRIIMIYNNKRRRQCYFIVWGKEIFERFIDFIFISYFVIQLIHSIHLSS